MPIRQRIVDRFGDHDIDETGEVPGNPTLDAILSRASCRSFEDEAVSDTLLETLLAAAFSAPSKSDLQQRSVIIVRDADKKARIAELSDTAWLAQAPLLLVWCGDHRRFRKVAAAKGHGFANDHLDAFFNATVDAAIAMQTFIIAAESAGLGCCPISQIRNQVDAVSGLLELPELVFPIAGLCVGWPREQVAISMRLPLELTVHNDTYQEPDDLMAQVDAYDKRREALQPTPPEFQRDPERFGQAETYGWSEDHARQYAKSARASFGSYIRKQKFNLD